MNDNNDVDLNSFINDKRNINEFKGTTLSRYKKTEVKKELLNNILKNKIEHASNWCAELICSGHFMDIWEIILLCVGKYIHLGNPKMVLYVEMRYNFFKNIMNKGHFMSELDLRNDIQIRKLFAELICVVSLSKKKGYYEPPVKINGKEEFDITQMTEKFKAPNIHFIEPVFKKKDPQEIYIALNEFAYNLSCNNSNSACYWIEWIVEFNIICIKKKNHCHCERRDVDVEYKYQRDIVWIIWDAIIHHGENKEPHISKLLSSLLHLFCIKYTTSSCKKRMHLLYFAVNLLTENVMVEENFIYDKEIVQNVVDNINCIYKNIKKNEMSPGTEYLFSSLKEKQSNFEKSLKKMDLMNSFSTTTP